MFFDLEIQTDRNLNVSIYIVLEKLNLKENTGFSQLVSLHSSQQVLSPIHQVIFLTLLNAHSEQKVFAIEPLNY